MIHSVRVPWKVTGSPNHDGVTSFLGRRPSQILIAPLMALRRRRSRGTAVAACS